MKKSNSMQIVKRSLGQRLSVRAAARHVEDVVHTGDPTESRTVEDVGGIYHWRVRSDLRESIGRGDRSLSYLNLDQRVQRQHLHR